MSYETIQYRDTTEADLAPMALVMERAIAQRDAQPVPSIPQNSKCLADILVRAGRIGAHSYVAADQERIAGFALSHPLIAGGVEEVGTEHLALLMVDPDYMGKKIASTLLGLVAERARISGKNRLTLWTRQEDNTHAQTVYTHKGFTPTGLTKTSDFSTQVQYALPL